MNTTADPWRAAWQAGWEPFPEPVVVRRAAKASPEDPDLEKVFSGHQEWTDSLISEFEKSLKRIVESAASKTVDYLRGKLSITEGNIDPTAANDSILKSTDTTFMKFLFDEGYGDLVGGYTAEFPGQLPFLQQMLDAIGESLGRELPAVDFSASDLKVLGRIESATAGKLESLFEGAIVLVVQRALFSVAALPFEQLVSVIASEMEKTRSAARTWADTSVSMWYRTASSLTFDAIQSESPKDILRFRYSGPLDIKTREFCAGLLAGGETYTKDQISEMDNGQLPGVFITCGGYNCRHLWVLSKQ